jgi:hypothetical protein
VYIRSKYFESLHAHGPTPKFNFVLAAKSNPNMLTLNPQSVERVKEKRPPLYNIITPKKKKYIIIVLPLNRRGYVAKWVAALPLQGGHTSTTGFLRRPSDFRYTVGAGPSAIDLMRPTSWLQWSQATLPLRAQHPHRIFSNLCIVRSSGGDQARRDR